MYCIHTYIDFFACRKKKWLKCYRNSIFHLEDTVAYNEKKSIMCCLVHLTIMQNVKKLVLLGLALLRKFRIRPLAGFLKKEILRMEFLKDFFPIIELDQLNSEREWSEWLQCATDNFNRKNRPKDCEVRT